jgi:hypothetical protein
MVTLRQRLLQGRVGYGIEGWVGDYIRHHVQLKHVSRSFADTEVTVGCSSDCDLY